MSTRRTAVVVGSGPNGLAAAITLARAGFNVRVLEANATIGGGVRSAELTLPGFIHDSCSAIHPLAVASPFFRSLTLEEHGVEWVHSPVPLAHPMDDGTAVVLHRSIASMNRSLGPDAPAYRRLMTPLVSNDCALVDAILSPVFTSKHPLNLLRFGLSAMRSASSTAVSHFHTERARALFGGIAAHSNLKLTAMGSASFGMVLATLGHVWGWPFPKGGAQKLVNALQSILTRHGGICVTNCRVDSHEDVADADIVMFDVTPRELMRIGADRLPRGYRRRLRCYRYGPAVFKIDWALSGPIPWRAAECRDAATIHVGGTLREIEASEHAVSGGRHAERPFVILAQQSLFDASRAPAGAHTAWGYCHVPNGYNVDLAENVEDQIERFAPGFRDIIVKRRITTPTDFERNNANYVGGDVIGGANDLAQFIFRPFPSFDPYSVPVRGWYLCSASTPPGGGVHGMSGYNAACTALRHICAD